MIINKAYKVRLYPTIKQRIKLAQHFGCARWVYNYFLELKIKQYKETKKSATFVETNRLLTKLKQEPSKQWLQNVSRQCVTNSLRNLDIAFKNFFSKKTKYPTFKNRHNKQSFKISAFFCKIINNKIHLPQLNGINTSGLNLPNKYKLISMTLSKTVTNKYYASINTEQEIPEPIIDISKPEIGIDFGLKMFITTSDNNKIDIPKYNLEYKRLHKIHSRRINKSHRKEKARLKLALFYEKFKNKLTDFHHKLSSRLVRENQAIYIEDLNIKGMMNRFGKQLNNIRWRSFTNQLEYKGRWYNCDVIKINRFYPSSKKCSICGKINNITLSDRIWTCSGCNSIHDRDFNAAKNILEYGRTDRNLRSQRVGVVNPLAEARNH